MFKKFNYKTSLTFTITHVVVEIFFLREGHNCEANSSEVIVVVIAAPPSAALCDVVFYILTLAPNSKP